MSGTVKIAGSQTFRSSRAEAAKQEYAEFAPGAVLASCVATMWSLTCRGDATMWRVVPDGCIDIVMSEQSGCVVAGPSTEHFLVDLGLNSEWVGVRFRPGVAPTFLGVHASELCNSVVPLDTLWGAEAREQTERLLDVPANARLDQLEAILLHRARKTSPTDPAVRATIGTLLAHPNAGIADAAESIGISSRQLLRRFERAVGYGPKVFARVVRFQRAMRLAHQARSARLDLVALAFAAGYCDQQHMSRDFRAMAGLPPATLLNNIGEVVSQGDSPQTLR